MSTTTRRRPERGQSIVEFALVLPLLLFVMVAVVDIARIYTTMLSVESAAREAADYGTFGSEKWSSTAVANTLASMEKAACVAATNLPEYQGPDDNCANPLFSYCVTVSPPGGTCVTPYTDDLGCDNPTREPPCQVSVTLQYRFDLIAPIHIELLGVGLGFPDSITFERTSTFAMTDLDLP